MRTWDLVSLLARRFALTRYLQISTGTTSKEHLAHLDLRDFSETHAFLYADPGQLEILPEAARYPSLTAVKARLLGSSLRRLVWPRRERYDLVFVDPWHSLASSAEALGLALRLARPEGVVVVHDCNPLTAELARIDPRGSIFWCGETYRAFLDLALTQGRRGWITVDDDYGMGVLLPEGTAVPGRAERDRLRAFWADASDAAAAWVALARHRPELLRLVAPDDVPRALGDRP